MYLSDIRELSCDVLVCGTGLAGLRAAYDLGQKGCRVLLISRGQFCSGSSFYPKTAALGSQNPSSEEDKEDYLREVLKTGCGVADEKLVRRIIDCIPREIRRLPELGIHPSRLYAGRPACFAEKERILYSWGGWEKIRQNARERFACLAGVTVLEHTDLLWLSKKEGKIAGAILCDQNGQIFFVKTGAVILATGGTCGLYKHSLNTDDTAGSGHSIALYAGAELINMEFLQFIPGFTKPVYQLLFSETTLRQALSVKNADGEEALSAFLSRNAPDISLEACLWDRALHGPFTTEDRSQYFELALMEDAVKNHRECGFEIRFRPEIAEDSNGFITKAREMYAPYGIDLSKDPIWLSSFAHCANGGIRINEKAETGVPGLYAAGEAAGGIHGADRHGGMATSAALCYGTIAAESAAAYVKEQKAAGQFSEADAEAALSEFLDLLSGNGGESLSCEAVLSRLGESLWIHANALRSEESLTETLTLIRMLKEQFDALSLIREGTPVSNAVKTFHALRTAEAMVTAMLCRKESRGPHFRSDYPQKDPAMEGKRILIREGNLSVI